MSPDSTAGTPEKSNASDSRSQQIFVVGCPRSGTSPFARLLAKSGLRTAEDQRRTRKYPGGYYEYMPILMYHKALERLRGGDHRITTEPFLRSDDLQDEFIRGVFYSSFRPVLEREFDFVKFPQLALSVDFLIEQFRDAHIVALWRNPACTFRSLVTKEFPRDMLPASLLKSLLLWNVYAYHTVRARERWGDRVTVLSIDDVIENDWSTDRLLHGLGYKVPAMAISECINRDIWNQRVDWRWRAAHRLALATCRIAGGRFGGREARLADVTMWRGRLRAITQRV